MAISYPSSRDSLQFLHFSTSFPLYILPSFNSKRFIFHLNQSVLYIGCFLFISYVVSVRMWSNMAYHNCISVQGSRSRSEFCITKYYVSACKFSIVFSVLQFLICLIRLDLLLDLVWHAGHKWVWPIVVLFEECSWPREF